MATLLCSRPTGLHTATVMNKQSEHDTREHLLATGGTALYLRGFTGMGLSELLKTARGAPKGSFYHYFARKEAFGVAMLERHYACYHQRLTTPASGPGNHRDRLLARYIETLKQFCPGKAPSAVA